MMEPSFYLLPMSEVIATGPFSGANIYMFVHKHMYLYKHL